MVVCGGGKDPGNPSPGHGAASGEAKASTSKTPPHPTGRVSPLLEERKKATRTCTEKESINGPKEESVSTQDSSLDPTAPLRPPPGLKAPGKRSRKGGGPLMIPPRQQRRLSPRILKRPTPSHRPGCKRVSRISTGSAKVAWSRQGCC